MKAQRHNQAGFTLIELVLVVSMIGIISAMALPRLLMAKQAADASSAIASLRTIASSEAGYSTSCGNGFYSPDLPTLAIAPAGTNSPFISPDLSYAPVISKSQYTIQMMGTATPTAPATCNGLAAGAGARSFKAGADPTVATNYRYFAVNSANTIYEDSATLYAAMPEVGVPAAGHPLQ
jgi:prepilin-type N-terminal cleavage/methylation domain-containing protein